MQTLLTDLKLLIISHWKTILILILTSYIFYCYPDIKQGIADAWTGK
jgi:hypothetical protein